MHCSEYHVPGMVFARHHLRRCDRAHVQPISALMVAAPALFMNVPEAIFATTFDGGAMLSSGDFYSFLNLALVPHAGLCACSMVRNISGAATARLVTSWIGCWWNSPRCDALGSACLLTYNLLCQIPYEAPEIELADSVERKRTYGHGGMCIH